MMKLNEKEQKHYEDYMKHVTSLPLVELTNYFDKDLHSFNDFRISDIRKVSVQSQKGVSHEVFRVFAENSSISGIENLGWIVNDNISKCLTCCSEFGTVKDRRHHCRLCGLLVCGSCCSYKEDHKAKSPSVLACNDCCSSPKYSVKTLLCHSVVI
jgi:hypothetical protein